MFETTSACAIQRHSDNSVQTGGIGNNHQENTQVYKDVNQPSTFETTPTYVIISHSDNSAQIVGIGNDRQENIPVFEDV